MDRVVFESDPINGKSYRVVNRSGNLEVERRASEDWLESRMRFDHSPKPFKKVENGKEIAKILHLALKKQLGI